MEDLKKAVREAPCLRSLDYDIDTEIKLLVDTSYIAIGWYISQEDAEIANKWWYARFGSTLLSPREARRLVVETDAQYIKGMLNHPEEGPNATINRWIEAILMYHFELRHVAGKTFAADGLSRRVKQPGDPDSEPWDHSHEDHDGLKGYAQPNEEDPEPLDFEEFKREIDTRGGYMLAETKPSVELLGERMWLVTEIEALAFMDKQVHGNTAVRKQLVNVEVLPNSELKGDPEVEMEYNEERRTGWAKKFDDRLPKIKRWLQGPLSQPEGIDPKDFGKWVRECSHFFEKDDKLYRRQGKFPQIVVQKQHRMYMMRAAHDSLGHRGAWATIQFLTKRFWWPDLEGDVAWYCKTCHVCQVLHADVMHMMPASNGCKYIVHGSPSFEKATAWLQKKYGIKGIKISPYNSQANGRVERPHYDIRDMLFKATGGKTHQWFWYLPHVLWADRITARKRFGVSPFFILTGAEPVVPLDIQEATWLVEPPSGPLTTAELIGQRAKALAKHRDLVEEMRKRVDKEKRDRVARYEEDNAVTIKDYRF
ncbi:hypothetical protein H1R20_g10492, partial [Candolleomyces eurysporus]